MANRSMIRCSTPLISGNCKSMPLLDITSFLLKWQWLLPERQTITSAVEDVEKRKYLCIAAAM